MIINDTRILRRVLSAFGAVFAFDTETVEACPDSRPSLPKGALILDRARMTIFSVSGLLDGKVSSFSVPLKEHFGEPFMRGADLVKTIQPFMLDDSIMKVAHNLVYDTNVLMNHGLEVNNGYCTLVASRLLDENNPADLKTRATQIGMLLEKFKNVDPSNMKNFSKYAEQDAEATFRLYLAYEGKDPDHRHLMLSEANRKIMWEQEFPFLKVIIALNRRGMLVDERYMNMLYDNLFKSLVKMEKRIFQYAGHSFNINSPKQLQKVLYEEMHIQPPAGAELEAGGYSTDESTLLMIGSNIPIIKALLEFRAATKLSKLVDPDIGLVAHSDQMGYIHSTLSSTGAETFRLSSSLPNLQNIPSRKDSLGIRKGFIAPKNHVMLVLDYDGMEAKFIANVCKEPTMLKVFNSPEGDLHQATADSISIGLSGETGHISRGLGKTLNFGLFYGMAKDKLSAQLTFAGYPTSPDEAQKYIDLFFETYKIRPFKKWLIQQYEKDGYLEHITGRRRTFPNMESHSKRMRAYGERQLFNSLIQGGCSDWLKHAMIRIENDERLKEWGCQMVMTVHDEILFYVPRYPSYNPRRCMAVIKRLMEKPPTPCLMELGAPLTVSGGWGLNWQDAKH